MADPDRVPSPGWSKPTSKAGRASGTPSLRRNFSVTTVGGVVYAACQFGMLAILAQLTTPIEVGRYALALAITGPVFIFANLKLRQVLATDAHAEYSFGQYLGQRIISTAVAAMALVAAILVSPLDGRTAATAAAVTASKALESIIDILYGAMQRREQMHLIARAQVVRGLGGLLIFGVLLLLTKRVELAALGLAVFTVPLIAASVVRVKRLGIEARPTFSRAQQKKLTRLALPLGVSVTAGAVAVNVPRYFIEGVEGTAALGIFAALAYVLTLGGTIVGSLAQAASPRLANLYVSGERVQFRRTLRLLIICGGVLGCAGILASVAIGEVALRIVFGDEYAARSEVLVVLMVAAALQYLVAFLGTAVNAIRKFTIQMPISLGTLLTVSAAAAWGVPRFGLMGAALAVLASQIFTGLCYMWLHFSVVRPAIANSEI